MYFAVIECVPALSDDTVSEAAPLLRVAVERSVDPSRNCTLPVGVPPAADTTALNVTAWPAVEGLREEVSEVVVPEFEVTVSLSAGETLDAYKESPPYAAVMECVPAVSELIVSEARPLERFTVASALDPSRNWMLPEGVPPLDAVTAAVNVIACPAVAGLAEAVKDAAVGVLVVVA